MTDDPLASRRRMNKKRGTSRRRIASLSRRCGNGRRRSSSCASWARAWGSRSGRDSRAGRTGIHDGDREAAATDPGAGDGVGRGRCDSQGTADGRRLRTSARNRGSERGGPSAPGPERRPEESVFRRAGRLISALFTSGGRFDLTPDDLLKSCEAIADASGGLFGIHRVSADERATLERIAHEIESRQA